MAASPSRLPEVGAAFLRLGLISFGGPVAHLGYFRKEFVERRRWLDDEAYADLVALCQFLPGPASSQVAFGIGMRRAGRPGGVLASVAFLLPSAVAMILFAHGVRSIGNVGDSGWLQGLKVAAVAVVALAVLGMARRLCPDWPRRTVAVLAAGIVLLVPGVLGQVGVLALCGLIGFVAWPSPRVPSGEPRPAAGRTHFVAVASLALFGALLALLPLASSWSGARSVEAFDHFYRAGSLVFGGGHVVLPLLRSEVVAPGWVSDDLFLAGYGAVQAAPGPLFTFAGYLGALIASPSPSWVGGAWALLAIFLPGWLLVSGTYPFWHLLREKAWAQGVLAGANAAVVGLLLAALYRPVCTEGIRTLRDAAAAVVAFILLGTLRLPPWVVVALMALVGQWFLR